MEKLTEEEMREEFRAMNAPGRGIRNILNARFRRNRPTHGSSESPESLPEMSKRTIKARVAHSIEIGRTFTAPKS